VGFRGLGAEFMEPVDGFDVEDASTSFPVLSSGPGAGSQVTDEREYVLTTLGGSVVAGQAGAARGRVEVLTALCSLLLDESEEDVSLELTSGEEVMRAVSCGQKYIYIDLSSQALSRAETRRHARDVMNALINDRVLP